MSAIAHFVASFRESAQILDIGRGLTKAGDAMGEGT